MNYRHKIGYVPQEPQLFNSTVTENLLWSVPEATNNDIWAACKLANADEFIRELPYKLNTELGDRGIRLSGGQRQQVAVGRAMMTKPTALMLDEPTAGVAPIVMDELFERIIEIKQK